MTTTVTLNKKIDFTPMEMIKLTDSRKYLEDSFNSLWFKEGVLNHTWNGKKQFANNGGKTNEEIYDRLMNGIETLSPKIDNDLDVSITIYTSSWWSRGTIGYTYPNIEMQFINRRWFSQFTYRDVGGNIAHEWCHKSGFVHDFKRTDQRDFSVPYGIGYILAAGARKEKSNVVAFCEHREKGFLFDKVLSA